MQFFRRSRKHINFPELLRLIAHLVMIEGSFMLFPLITSLVTNDGDAHAFALAIGVCALFSGSILLCDKPRDRYFGKRDGLLLTALIWVIFSLFSMIPLMLSSAQLGPVDAFFESMSGFTTTGASIIPDVETLSPSIMLWRCLMQWIGGIGIVIFTIALLPMLNTNSGMQMFHAELSGVTHDKISPRISQTALRLCSIYIILTTLLCIALYAGPMDFFDSICHSLSTVSTGGYSTRNASIGAWDSLYVRSVIILFMFLGGVSFVVLYRISLGRIKVALRDETLKTYIGAIVAITIFVTIVLIVTHRYQGLKQIIVDPLFQVVSFITSTGYTVSNLPNWDKILTPILLILMFSGACAGSTSGGAKIDRLIYLWKNSGNELNRLVHPNRYYPLTFNGRVRAPELIDKVTSFLWFYIAMIFLGGTLLSMIGMPVIDSFYSSLSCMGNTGVGYGTTAATFAGIPFAAKIILPILMLIGRLEIFTIIILFTRAFWNK